MARRPPLRLVLGVLLIAGTIAYLLGPRAEVDTKISLPDLPDDLDGYFAQSEAAARPYARKRIEWAFPDKRQTEVSLIYLHGFSASSQETSPLTEEVAREFSANVFYARLRGHGENAEALGRARASEWIQDTSEAFAIGKRLGKRVVIIGCSTGATLATRLAQALPRGSIHALIFISPNYGAKQFGASLAAGPWGSQITRLLAGPTYSFAASRPEHDLYWTNNFSTRVLVEVAALVKAVTQEGFGTISTPALVFYSERDAVVRASGIKKAFRQFGSAKKELVLVSNSDSTSQHVLAGRIDAPSSHAMVREEIIKFIRALSKE